MIDGALSFNGSQSVYMGNADCSYPGGSPTTVVDNWTLEAWLYPSNLSQFSLAVYNGNDSGGYGFGVGNGSGGSGSVLTGLLATPAWVNSQYAFPSANTWYHVVMVRASGTTSFYVNGAVQTGTSTTTPNSPANEFSIGSESCSLKRPFNGSIDEVRISSTARSANWIQTEYNNQASPATFYGVGAEQTFTMTLTSSQNPSLAGGAVTFTATVAGSGGTPTGTVTFKDGANTLGTGTLSTAGQPANTAVANFSTTSLGVTNSPHTIIAVYGGDSNFYGSTSFSLSQTVSGPGNITINNPSFENPSLSDNGHSYAVPPSWTPYGYLNAVSVLIHQATTQGITLAVACFLHQPAVKTYVIFWAVQTAVLSRL